MKRILATGDKPEVFNGECGAESGTVPVSAVAPAMLVSEIETQRQPQGIERPPILPIPSAPSASDKGGPMTFTSVCHPENPHSCGPASNDRCSWGKRSEGSAFCDAFRLLFGQIWLSAILALVLCTALPAQSTRADAAKDPILAAMLTELDRSVSQLQLPGFQKPFFIQYRIEDVDDFETKAAFGATEGSSHNHARVARVTVLVGDYKTDSSGGRGDGAIEMATLDDDPIALRSALWTATDQAYKNALAAYAQKQAELKQVETPPQADDFSHENPLVSLAAPADAQARRNRLGSARRARQRSLPHRRLRQISRARRAVLLRRFHARATTMRLVNSEGTIVRKSASSFQESFGVGTQAADGMRLDRSFATNGVALADLDSPDAFAKHAVELIASLADLRQAPLVEEEYHGPVLLSSDASADTLRRLLGSGITATRPRLGTEARTNGPFASQLSRACAARLPRRHRRSRPEDFRRQRPPRRV